MLHTFFIFLFINIFFTTSIFAKSEIYKCIDEQGQLTYSTLITCSNPETVGKRKINKKKDIDKKNKVNDNRLANCEESKSTFNSYQAAPFLTKTVKNKAGKEIKVRLSENEKVKVIQEAKDEVEYWCDSKSDN